MAIRRCPTLDKKYQFEYDVGQWTFGTVQVVKERKTGNLKTCKVVRRAILQFASEVLPRLRALQDLQHPHICSITDVLDDRDAFYILTDFHQGGDLQDWMERLEEGSWLQESACGAYIRQAAQALTHSHANQVYHRDLRPSSLLLTSKLPDAVVKVSDFGLAAILDPDGSLAQPSAYAMPELPQQGYDQRGRDSDIWSLGAIAHALLVGQPPNDLLRRSAGWGLSRDIEEDAWSERSDWSHDFTRRCLRRSQGQQPSAATLLWHPWLKGLTPLSGPAFRADTDTARDLRHRTLCYMLSVLLVPAVVPHKDFDELRSSFQLADADRDGLIPRSAAQRLLLQRRNLAEAVAPALSIVDVLKTDNLDLSAVAAADLIVRDFFAAGPTHAPLCGPFGATDLVGRMLEVFFRTFGERSNGSPSTVNAASLRARLHTATASDLEQHGGICFEDLLDCLPDDGPVDGQGVASALSMSEGRGTPLGTDGEAPIQKPEGWGLAGNSFSFSVAGLFQSCGVGGKRDDSPHSVRVQ